MTGKTGWSNSGRTNPGSPCLTAALVAVLLGGPSVARAGRVDGFTEPLRSVQVATTEVGIITAIKVQEGSTVERGDVLATLDDDVQQALLSIASQNLELRGRQQSQPPR